jgi:hypothetical protein
MPPTVHAPLPKKRVCDGPKPPRPVLAPMVCLDASRCVILYLGGTASTGARPKMNPARAAASPPSSNHQQEHSLLPERRRPCADPFSCGPITPAASLGSLQPARRTLAPTLQPPTTPERTTLGDKSNIIEDSTATPIVVVVPWEEY